MGNRACNSVNVGSLKFTSVVPVVPEVPEVPVVPIGQTNRKR